MLHLYIAASVQYSRMHHFGEIDFLEIMKW